jgi:NAD+ synthase (glutamine-hydrolysing)
LLLRKDFLQQVSLWADYIAKNTSIPALLGAPYGRGDRGLCYNAAILCADNQVSIIARKRLLPNYTVFDEQRYFSIPKSQACDVFTYKNQNFLVSICEDSWNSQDNLTPVVYNYDPIDLAFKQNTSINYIISLSASPYAAGKPALRELILSNLAKKYSVPILAAGQVGANDQLLFDGHSLVMNSHGEVLQRAPACEEDLLIYDTSIVTQNNYKPNPLLNNLELTKKALIMGINNYITKCGASGVILGLSGGIDSAICAVLAQQALGADRVRVFYLPSRFSSDSSLADAEALSNNLGLKLEHIAIEKSVQNLRDNLEPIFKNASAHNRDIGDQNIQARVRGLLLMGISNAINYYMINTSNKSELAVGYGTLYGDMCGAISPLGDMYKTQVRELAQLINKEKVIIPESIIKKPPTAELKPAQLDTDTLPDYAKLDKILYNYIDLDLDINNIKKNTNYDINIITRVINLVSISEYKRRQAPVIFMISNRVFGDGRRMPIARALPSAVVAATSHT